MTCTTCGSPLRAGAMFCGECGARVEPAAVVAAPPLIEPSARPVPPPPPPRAAVPAPPAPPAAPGWGADPVSEAPPPPVAAAASLASHEAAGPQPTVPVARLIDGLPLGLLDSAPAAPVRRSTPPVEPEGDLEATVLSPRRTVAWRIVTPGGDRHPITTATVIGRAPAPHPGAASLQLVDPTKSLSKSHALLDIVGDALVIEDLGSTNGIIVHDGTVELDLEAGQRTTLRTGMTLELGEYVLRIAHD